MATASAERTGHWTLREERALRGYSVEWAEPGWFILARRNELFRWDGVEAPCSLGRLRTPAARAMASRVRLAQRALRFTFYNVVRLDGGTLFYTFGRDVGVWRDGAFHPLPGLVRPTRVLRGACALDRDGSILFGEYVGNQERHEIHVYRYRPGAAALEVVHTFAPGEIRHVHGIYADPYSADLWCLAGDRPSECRMLRTSDQFRTIGVIGQGDETWRAVSVQFTEAGAYYGSDAEFLRNHLYFVERPGGERRRLAAIDGPVYYSCALGPELFFGVTAELCPSQEGRDASLWRVRDGEAGERVLGVPKDAFPVKLFQPGTWQFSRGPGFPDRQYVHLMALRGADNRTYELRRG